jgi:hypothetical protein
MSFSPGDYDPTLNPNPGARAPFFFAYKAINSIDNQSIYRAVNPSIA